MIFAYKKTDLSISVLAVFPFFSNLFQKAEKTYSETIGKIANGYDLIFAGDTVTADNFSHVFNFFHIGILFHHVLKGREVHVQFFRQVLMISSNFQVTVTTNHTISW